MPINFQQIRSAIHQFGQEAPAQAKIREQHLETALSLLKQCSQESEVLQDRIQLVLIANPDLRCALPTSEPLDSTHMATPSGDPITLLAADGSQIIPDQHLAVQFGVINVGLMRMQPGTTPRESIESDLLYAQDIFTEQGYLVGEELIALRRDHKERSHLLQAALQGRPDRPDADRWTSGIVPRGTRNSRVPKPPRRLSQHSGRNGTACSADSRIC